MTHQFREVVPCDAGGIEAAPPLARGSACEHVHVPRERELMSSEGGGVQVLLCSPCQLRAVAPPLALAPLLHLELQPGEGGSALELVEGDVVLVLPRLGARFLLLRHPHLGRVRHVDRHVHNLHFAPCGLRLALALALALLERQKAASRGQEASDAHGDDVHMGEVVGVSFCWHLLDLHGCDCLHAHRLVAKRTCAFHVHATAASKYLKNVEDSWHLCWWRALLGSPEVVVIPGAYWFPALDIFFVVVRKHGVFLHRRLLCGLDILSSFDSLVSLGSLDRRLRLLLFLRFLRRRGTHPASLKLVYLFQAAV
mmetsp:Transcript_20646/g.45228  ORF Transcript_20646/g.45228 Transcript_20646/m.45228 type:complete len:311 (-) Transcript_20646:322-1254(-)